MFYVFLPVALGFYFVSPLLNGNYAYTANEYELYKSFMQNFIETLRNGHLPLWNEYIGCGRPALYFGHYPIQQNTLLYLLFGFSNFTYYLTKGLGLAILFSSFIYAIRFLGFNYWLSLLGGLVYFGINFVCRTFIAETVGNLFFLYPILMILVIKIIRDKKVRDAIFFSALYVLWLSGGHIIYLYMNVVIFFVFFWATAFSYNGPSIFGWRNFIKLNCLSFLLFLLPFAAVLYQYYFVLDAIMASNRFKAGLVVSVFQLTVWKQLAVSFASSTYFWWGLFLAGAWASVRGIKWATKKTMALSTLSLKRGHALALLGLLTLLALLGIQVRGSSAWIADLLPILNSGLFRIALLTFLWLHWFFNRRLSVFVIRLSGVFSFIILTMLLSYFFFSPENIIGDVNGYDYDLFRELSVFSQFFFVFFVLYSVKEFGTNKIVRSVTGSLMVLYLIRSHFTIPLLRFAGVVWYAPRDGSIFSFLFSVFFLFGLQKALRDLFYYFRHRNERAVVLILAIFPVLLAALFVRDTERKIYLGTSHRYIYPNKLELTKNATEQWIIEGRAEVPQLNQRLIELKKATPHFFRLFTPENHYLYLCGDPQQYKIHDAAVYDSSVSREIHDLFLHTVLGEKPPDTTALKDVMPFFLFTKHVHAGLGLKHTEIFYGDLFLCNTKDFQYFKDENIGFFLELLRVKYLVVTRAFSDALQKANTHNVYKEIAAYPKLNYSIYSVTRPRSYATLGILPLSDGEDFEQVIRKINGNRLDVLQELYKKLIYLDKPNPDYSLLTQSSQATTRSYDIRANKKGLLIDFESWNHNWELVLNGHRERLDKAFQIFRGIPIRSGLNQIRLQYRLKFFFPLVWFGCLMSLAYLVLLTLYRKRNDNISLLP